MTVKKITFNRQILLVFLFSISFTILFSFFFIHYLYSKLYLTSIEESIIYQGQRTASHYHYGELSDEIIDKIQWYNVVSEYEIIVVDRLENLTTYFPYKIDYESLVTSDDLQLLQQGKYVMKNGFVEELDREIIGAIFPIKSEQGLIGFIYIYVPLAHIQDVFKESIPILLLVGSVFFLLLFFIVQRIWKSMYRPLKNLQQMAHQVAKGDFANELPIERNDEIGELTKAFNYMNTSLAQQEERKKEFTSNIVHELRTPLTYIRGYVEALRENIATSPEEANDYLATIEKESKRLNKLINDLVELNHLQENLYSIEVQPVVISQLLLDTIDIFRIHLTEKEIELQLDLNEDLIVLGDAQRIEQVFYNTIDNAVKYVNEKGTIYITLNQENKHAQFTIINEGTTIKQEDLSRIGERFFRTDKARTRTTGGTGLGLSIVKEIVRLHDGTFSIESNEEMGTKVTIHFPLLPSESEDLA